MAIVRLYNIPEMDITYENIPYFENKTAQIGWINAHRNIQLEGRISVDPTRTTITVDKSYAELERAGVNYCSLVMDGTKIMYYFISDYEYKTSAATTLILTLDVFQTYIYDVDLLESFVDRCHVNRYKQDKGVWIPAGGTVEEGLAFGDLMLEGVKTTEFRDKFIIASTTPLGKNLWNRPAQGGPDPELDCWESGKVSANLFRMAKGFEGFGPYEYRDSGGTPTIGYGTTKHDPDAWNELIKSQPVQEEKAAKLAYDAFNKRYADPIKDFVIKNYRVDNQHKFDALVDLAYNAGAGRVTDTRPGSLGEVLKQFPNDEAKVRPVWETWIIRDRPGGPIVPGLVARRKAECDMYFNGTYEKRKISIVAKGTGRPTGQYVTENNGDGWLPKECSTVKPGKGHFEAYGYDWVYPTHGLVTSVWYRQDGVTVHGALDVGCPVGTDIYATRDGVVAEVQTTAQSGGYGELVTILHDDIKMKTWYAHNSRILVRPGEKVKQGQVIAKSGNTGNSTGPHLHYELRRSPYAKGNRIVPIPHLKVGDKI